MRTMLLGLTALGMMAAAGAATPANFEVRLVVPCGPSDHALMLVGGDQEFCLAETTVFDGAGVVKVQRYPVVPKAVMVISEAAADRLYEAMSTKDVERIAFVFNGRLIFAPMIGDPVKITELQITLKNDPDDIDALVAAFPGSVAQ